MAIGAVTGSLPWPWQVSRTGSAVLLLTEDTEADAHRAVHSIAEHSGIGDAEHAAIAERLRIYPLAGEDNRLLTLTAGGQVEPSVRVTMLLAKLCAIPDLVLIGLDPAIALTDGSESDATHQRRLGELADRIAIETGATVVLTAHAAKALQAADELGSHSSRGSGAITDAVRAEYVLRTMTMAEGRKYGITKVEERRAYVQLAATKGNALPQHRLRLCGYAAQKAECWCQRS